MSRVGVSTSSFFPLPVEDAFRLAYDSGADGVEVMITDSPETYDPRVLDFLSRRFDLPILSIHAPVLLMTHGVFGHHPADKLERSAELAKMLGADTVVVHPPYRWQPRYARVFSAHVQEVTQRFGLSVAVENMFGWNGFSRCFEAYSPGWNPGRLDVPDLTLDFSHAAMQGISALELAQDWGPRLSHIHLCDGTSPGEKFHLFDEHLVPGRGTQPVADTLEALAAEGFAGHIVAEVSTKSARSEDDRVETIRASLDFARFHLRQGRSALITGAAG